MTKFGAAAQRMLAATNLPPVSYYEGLADELETIAEAVRKSPQLNHHFADRLKEMAKQMREDTKLMRLSGKSSGPN